MSLVPVETGDTGSGVVSFSDILRLIHRRSSKKCLYHCLLHTNQDHQNLFSSGTHLVVHTHNQVIIMSAGASGSTARHKHCINTTRKTSWPGLARQSLKDPGTRGDPSGLEGEDERSERHKTWYHAATPPAGPNVTPDLKQPFSAPIFTEECHCQFLWPLHRKTPP